MAKVVKNECFELGCEIQKELSEKSKKLYIWTRQMFQKMRDSCDFIEELHLIHPEFVGDILCPEFTKVGGYFCFIWNDDSEKMLRTSTIEDYFSNEDTIKVVTRNSVYYLQKENI